MEGIDFKLDELEAFRVEAEKKVKKEKIIASYPKPKPRIHTLIPDKAYYYPPADAVNMPHMLSFETPQDYYRTLFHELIHSTGHTSRLDRNLKDIKVFGTENYAKEELVAEFGVVFLSSYAGINWISNKNHPEYLKGWLNVIEYAEKNPSILLRAVINAIKAADFIAKDYLKTIVIKPKKQLKLKI